MKNKNMQTRKRRVTRIRDRIKKETNRNVMTIARSNRYISVQLYNPKNGKTLFTVTDQGRLDKAWKGMKKIERAIMVGEEFGKKAIAKHIHTVVFDRSGYMYHGRVKAVAEGARKAGLLF